MSLSAKEAAEQVGLTKQGIIKAIRAGKITAEKNESGAWRIDPAELFRVYEPVSSGTQQQKTVGLSEDTAILQREIELLREMLADKNAVITDLRQRLDAEADERRKLTLVLTDSQHDQSKGFWRRLFSPANTSVDVAQA